jgi:5-(carboxyamino)imidazole ribonucleotide mutase
MPAGVPVATVAINGAKNAGILACQILALEYKEIATKIERFKKELERDVLQRAKRVERNSYPKSQSQFNSKLTSSSTTTRPATTLAVNK